MFLRVVVLVVLSATLLVLAAPSSPASKHTVALTQQDDHTVNELKKHSAKLAVDLANQKQKLAKEGEEDEAKFETWRKSAGSQLLEATSLLRHQLTDYQETLSRTEDLERQLRRAKSLLEDSAEISRLSSRLTAVDENMRQLESQAVNRSTDFQSNTNIVNNWKTDIQGVKSTMLLPGSETNPLDTIVGQLDTISGIMIRVSTDEADAAAQLQSILGTLGEVSLLQQGSNVRSGADQIATLTQQLVVQRAKQDSALMRVESLRAEHNFLLAQWGAKHNRHDSRASERLNQISSLDALLHSFANEAKDWCPHKCSNNGKCVNNQCVCDNAFGGLDCSTPALQSALGQTANQTKKAMTELSPLRAFGFGTSTETFIMSDEISCPTPTTQVAVSLWFKSQGTPKTLVSVATSRKDSEFLLWVDDNCRALYLWVNSPINHQDGIEIGNFTHKNVCDGKWHHLVVSWDGPVGGATTFVDGKYWEHHWSVFNEEVLKQNTRIVLGHNQIHQQSEQQGGVVVDAFTGVMSDFFFIHGRVTPQQALQLFTDGAYEGSDPYIHWPLGSPKGTMSFGDVGSMQVGGRVFGSGGSFVPLLNGERAADCS